MRKKIVLFALIGAMLACQVIPTPPPLKSTPRPTPTATRPAPLLTAEPENLRPQSPTEALEAPGRLAPFPTYPETGFAPVQPVEWSPAELDTPIASLGPRLPAELDQIANLEVIAGLSLRQRTALLQNGFVIVRTREPQFAAIRARVSEHYGQPYYLTADAAIHALDLAVDELRLALEKEELHRRMIAVTRAALDQTLTYLPFVQGGELEADVLQAAVFLGTGLRLLDPGAKLPAAIIERAERQAAQVLSGRGPEDAVLIPGYRDDFTVYRPTPPYAGDADLEAFFRGRAWFGRAAFALDGANAGRAPLVLTLALRQAQFPPGSAAVSQAGPQAAVDEWARVADTLAFLEGPAAGYGPRQTAALMDQVYGPGLTIVGLRDAGKWEQIRRLASALPPAELGGIPLNPLLAAQTRQDWRWMSYGLRLDDAIGAFLAPHRVSNRDDAQNTPGALEWPAALGSPPALAVLQATPAGAAPAYADALGRVQTVLNTLDAQAWSASAETQSLYALSALTVAKGDAYPPALRFPAWQTRDLASALGAWITLRRPTKFVDFETNAPMTGSRPLSPTPPAAVEPNPRLFYRLAYLAAMLAEGLEQRGLTGVFTTEPAPVGLHRHEQKLLDLADRLQRLGDIAARELRGEPLTGDDWVLITAPLGAAEERTLDGVGLPPIPALVSLPGASHYAATGQLDRLYVLAPIGDQLYVAQGGIFSFYEFPYALYGQIDEPGWGRLLDLGLVEPPTWISALLWPEGAPVDALAFHAGDIFRITAEAERLNLRAAPGRASASLRRLSPGDTVTLLDQTAQADSQTWRQVRLLDGLIGWLLQDPTFFERL